jgi:hypothetical protein
MLVKIIEILPISSVTISKLLFNFTHGSSKNYIYFKMTNSNVYRNFKRANIPIINKFNVGLLLLKKRHLYLNQIKKKVLSNLELYSFKETLTRYLEKHFKYCFNLYLFVLPFTLRPAALVCLFMSYKLLRKYSLRFVLNTVVFALQRCPSIQGVNLKCSGRFTRKQRAVSIRVNSVTKQNRPSNTFTAFIDYSFRSIKLENSLCGIKL